MAHVHVSENATSAKVQRKSSGLSEEVHVEGALDDMTQRTGTDAYRPAAATHLLILPDMKNPK